jgi:hypothetical protein
MEYVLALTVAYVFGQLAWEATYLVGERWWR